MFFVTVKGDFVICPVDLPVYPYSGKPFAVQVPEELLVGPFFFWRTMGARIVTVPSHSLLRLSAILSGD